MDTAATYRVHGPWASISDGCGRIMFLLECIRPLQVHFQENEALKHLFEPSPCVAAAYDSASTTTAGVGDNSSATAGAGGGGAATRSRIAAKAKSPDNGRVTVHEEEANCGMFLLGVRVRFRI